MTEPYLLLQQAREFAKKKKFSEAEKNYAKLIDELKNRLDDSDKSKMELWSSKAELLHMKLGYKLKNETWEDARNRGLDCLRYLNKCSNINEEYDEKFKPNIKLVINQIIMTYGCTLPENDTHVVISCPIYLRRHTGAGKYSTSIAFTYEKACCSICNLDLLDENCPHEVGETYDGKFCGGEYEGIKFQHLALVEKPKDPNAIGTKAIYFPKKEYCEKFDQEELRKAREKGLSLNCHSCRDTKFDPSEITLKMFFEMQGIDLNSEPSF